MRIWPSFLRPAALATLACAALGRASAQPPVPALSDMAAAWSGGPSSASCRDALGTADVPAAFRLRTCGWPRVTRGREFGQVTGTQGPGGGLHTLTWERAVADSGVAARLADSLGTALRASGLTEYGCPNAGRRWQRSGLTVQYTRGVVHGDGLLRVSVFATTLPDAVPGFVCPQAPKLPARSAPGQRGRAAM